MIFIWKRILEMNIWNIDKVEFYLHKKKEKGAINLYHLLLLYFFE